MKVAVEAKSRKRFIKLTKVYDESYDEWKWNLYSDKSCIRIKDGAFSDKDWFKKEGYKILTWKEWKAVRREVE